MYPCYVQDLIDSDTDSHTAEMLTLSVDDLPEFHAQLLSLADRGDYVARAAGIVSRLHETLVGFPAADPRSVTLVLRELIAGLRRGPLRPSEGDLTRFDVAEGWLANIRMHRRSHNASADL